MRLPFHPARFSSIVLALLTTLLVCVAAAPPVNIIFDTDMGADCDDVGALFMLHGAVERGEVKLLATMGCTSSEFNGPCIDAINTWFGRPEVPVGTLRDPGLLSKPGYASEIAARFPHRLPGSRDYPDAVALYRNILANQPDGSVVVLAVGPLRNLANLLKSRQDAASALDGPALIAKKVKRLDVMGGKYPPDASKHAKDGEFNFMQDPASTALVCSTWPTPVLFNGEGGSTMSGRRVTYEMPEHNPLTVAYMLSASSGFAGDRLSWDPISCLVAIRGAAPWYRIVTGGANVADSTTGVNFWQPGGDRNHSYLVLDQRQPKAEVEAALEELMVAGKPHPGRLNFDTIYYTQAGIVTLTCSGERDKNGVWSDQQPSSWIHYQHVDGRKYLVNSYAIVATDPQRLPRTLELSASNNGGKSWTMLDRREAAGFTRQTPRREFTISNPAKWNLYRLNVAAANPSEGTRIDLIELNEEIRSRPDVPVANVALDHTALTIPVHSRATLNATIAPGVTFEREVRWSSSDPAIAEMRQIGEQIAVVVGKKTGACKVIATVGNVQQISTVTVTAFSLPSGWSYDELNAPPIPGAVSVADGIFTLTGCGHAMTSFWERIKDQGVFASRALIGDGGISARLARLSPNVGGPNRYPNDRRPATASGLMIRESLTEPNSRYVLVQVEASGRLVTRWRDDLGHGGKLQELGKVNLPLHLKLIQTGQAVNVFTSTDGTNWGAALFSHTTKFANKRRAGLFVCSGNPVSSATAEFDSVQASE
jgi:inosine-uridine nucleoside N-ribohydrolase